jgi:Carboxypeptidase regulatory-like domain
LDSTNFREGILVRSCIIRGIIIAALTSIGLYAQGSSSLRGVITDAQKSAIPLAKVTLMSKDAGLTRASVTSTSGEYSFLQIRPGVYTLTVEAPGFDERKVDEVKLLVDTPASLDVSMAVAAVTSTVDVEADAQQLNTVDASVGNAFEELKIQSLPLQTRNVVQLLSLQPGVTQSGEVMGARRDQNNITLDGVDNNDNQNPLSGLNGTSGAAGFNSSSNSGFTTALPIPLDSMQEFRVTVAGQGASAGHSSGGQVSLVTRSGSNVLHGSAYEYNRNTDYTANSFFNNRSGLSRPQLVRNQFGASLGGPAKKNKVFYFLNYERRIDSSQQTQSRLVPTESLKAGQIKFKTTDGTTYTLNPSDIAAIDPLHIGVTSTMLGILKQYPASNAPGLALTNSDSGLNFGGFLFNAPIKLDYSTYVGRFDWNVDSAGKHVVSFRGTLSNNSEASTAAQFPGQDPASNLLQDNKGFGLRYTTVLSPSMTNSANVGVTRIGFTQTGATGASFGLGAINTLQNYTIRPSTRINPTWNFSDEFNWIRGSHTITAGVNMRWIDNNLNSFSNSYPSYSMSRGVLLGLGQDIYTAALNYVANGNAALKLANSTAVTNAFGDVLGLINSYSATYQYVKDGSVLPFGQPRLNDFVTHNYEVFLQDSWKATPKFTVTYGLHYEYDTPPYEVNGLQVATSPGLNTYFANRAGAMYAGIPGNQLPSQDKLTYSLNGPVNGKASWYNPDKNNFAPRISAAYAFNSSTVIRAGGALVFDTYGNDLVASISRLGSVGLSTNIGTPTSYNFTTSPRYGSGVLPALTSAPAGGFPFTPPNIAAISGTYFGIDPSLKAPYSYLLNASVSHEFLKQYTLEAGYTGRLSHAQLLQQDAFAPAIYFKDPKSGQNWVQSSTQLYNLAQGGVTAAAVKANPALVPANPFVENMFPALANLYIPGSASANYFYGVYGNNGGSFLDNLHQLDRVTSAAFPNCIVATGCYTFFAPQGSADPTWTNAGAAAYNALVVTVRRPFSKGVAFDFNYTWAHSIDNGSGVGSGSGQFGGILQNVFAPSLNRGSSDFDLRHSFNANFVAQLPFGRGKMLLKSAPRWLDEVVGNWEVSGLVRVQSGLPTTISGFGNFNSNYWNSSPGIALGALPETGSFIDNNGVPSIFKSTSAATSFVDAPPGGAPYRAIVRLPWQKNTDVTVRKTFTLPWEHHMLEIRADAYNVFNNVNFTSSTSTSGVSLNLASPSTFGEFSKTSDARVLQVAMRYTF